MYIYSATAEARNDQGQTLLSIAAQRDDLPLARFLLEHWKSMDADRCEYAYIYVYMYMYFEVFVYVYV